jgi:Holliday junction resolvasome RuvABC endonuclease subunit
MKILALDPGTHFGWALDKNIYGVWDLSTRRDESTGFKLVRFKSYLEEICKMEKIDVISFERPAGRNITGIISHAKFQGIIEDYCLSNNIQYRGYSASEIKKFATGKGIAKKEQMIQAAKKKLGYPGNDDNEADALWILQLTKYDLNIL